MFKDLLHTLKGKNPRDSQLIRSLSGRPMKIWYESVTQSRMYTYFNVGAQSVGAHTKLRSSEQSLTVNKYRKQTHPRPSNDNEAMLKSLTEQTHCLQSRSIHPWHTKSPVELSPTMKCKMSSVPNNFSTSPQSPLAVKTSAHTE